MSGSASEPSGQQNTWDLLGMLAGDILGDLYPLLAHAQPRGIVALPSTCQCIWKAGGGRGQEASASPEGPGTCFPAVHVREQGGSQLVPRCSLHTPFRSCTEHLCHDTSITPFLPSPPSSFSHLVPKIV